MSRRYTEEQLRPGYTGIGLITIVWYGSMLLCIVLARHIKPDNLLQEYRGILFYSYLGGFFSVLTCIGIYERLIYDYVAIICNLMVLVCLFTSIQLLPMHWFSYPVEMQDELFGIIQSLCVSFGFNACCIVYVCLRQCFSGTSGTSGTSRTPPKPLLETPESTKSTKSTDPLKEPFIV